MAIFANRSFRATISLVSAHTTILVLVVQLTKPALATKDCVTLPLVNATLPVLLDVMLLRFAYSSMSAALLTLVSSTFATFLILTELAWYSLLDLALLSTIAQVKRVIRQLVANLLFSIPVLATRLFRMEYLPLSIFHLNVSVSSKMDQRRAVAIQNLFALFSLQAPILFALLSLIV